MSTNLAVNTIVAEQEYVFGSENFEYVATIGPITIPKSKEVKKILKKHFLKRLFKKGILKLKYRMPSTPFVAGQRKVIKVFRLCRKQSSHQCLDFIIKSKDEGILLPNCYGLAVAYITGRAVLPNLKPLDKVLGLDYVGYLSEDEDGTIQIPELQGAASGYTEFSSIDWGLHCLSGPEVYLIYFCNETKK